MNSSWTKFLALLCALPIAARACASTGPVGSGDSELIAVPQFVISGIKPPVAWTTNLNAGQNDSAGDPVAGADQAETTGLALTRARADIEGALLRAYHQYQLISDFDELQLSDYEPLDCPLVLEYVQSSDAQCLVEKTRRGAQVTTVCESASSAASCDSQLPVTLSMNVLVNGSTTMVREMWNNIASSMEKYLIGTYNVGMDEDIQVEKIS